MDLDLDFESELVLGRFSGFIFVGEDVTPDENVELQGNCKANVSLGYGLLAKLKSCSNTHRPLYGKYPQLDLSVYTSLL